MVTCAAFTAWLLCCADCHSPCLGFSPLVSPQVSQNRALSSHSTASQGFVSRAHVCRGLVQTWSVLVSITASSTVCLCCLATELPHK